MNPFPKSRILVWELEYSSLYSNCDIGHTSEEVFNSQHTWRFVSFPECPGQLFGHPTSCLMNTRALFPGGKAAGARS